MADRRGGIAALGARVHIFVQPHVREKFTWFVRDVLGCEVVERDFGLPQPILVVPFPDGSAFSVEFSPYAPKEPPDGAIDDERAFHGAWIEFRTDDVAGIQQRLRDAGIREFRHLGSSHAYFSSPGGQVFRLLDLTYQGP